MTTEYAGAVEVAPPLRGSEAMRLTGSGWTTSLGGRALRPQPGWRWADAVHSLRGLVTLDAGLRRYDGVVVAYDEATGVLVTITARGGRVTRRRLRRPSAPTPSNVIDLATHRRTISRAIG